MSDAASLLISMPLYLFWLLVAVLNSVIRPLVLSYQFIDILWPALTSFTGFQRVCFLSIDKALSVEETFAVFDFATGVLCLLFLYSTSLCGASDRVCG